MTTPLTPEDVQANLDTFKEAVPTFEEQIFSTCMATWNGDALVDYDHVITVMVAPISLRVLSVALVWDYFSITASDTNYWRARIRAGDATKPYKYIAARSTQKTGAETNGDIVARKAWTFDAAAWTDVDLVPGDLLQLHMTQGGVPAQLRYPMTATVRYAAL
jgi:hypothetical protein